VVFNVVYCGDIYEPHLGYFNNFAEAINKVSDNGKVYITNDIIFSSTISLNKSIEITSQNATKPKIIFTNTNGRAFNLRNPSHFKLSNVHIHGSTNDVIISGSSKYLEISDSVFENCRAIEMQSIEEREIKVIVSHSSFRDSSINLEFAGEIKLFNNSFTKDKWETLVRLKDINIDVRGNSFHDATLRLDGKAKGAIQNNTFTGNVGRIYITAKGDDLSFNYNSILKGNSAIYYNSNTPIDFTKNWWGSPKGPKSHIFERNEEFIDYSNWALFPDFSRFSIDPYTISDLIEAIGRLGNDVEDCIYDLNDDGKIELLDLIGLIRKIP